MLGNGPNYSLKVGKTSQGDKEVAENVEIALANALAHATHLDGIKFINVQSVSLQCA